jgi:hypothetical protein
MGHTYGAQGIWNWKRPGDDETHLAGPQIGPLWTESLDLAGAAQCGIGATLLRSVPWWRLRPTPERARSVSPETPPVRQPACAQVPDERWLVYLPADPHDVALLGLERQGWRARWIDPRAGTEQEIGPVDVPDDGVWPVPGRPSADDWVLVLRRG